MDPVPLAELRDQDPEAAQYRRVQVTGEYAIDDEVLIRSRVHPTGGAGFHVVTPLLLDDEEAVAVAIGLRGAAAGAVDGIEETSIRALTKLEQLLPSRLRRRVAALTAATVTVPPIASQAPSVDPEALVAIASACRDHERLRFDYAAGSGTESRRVVEPHRIVSPETAATMRRMLEGVILNGTGNLAQLDGYTAGGKTGTAQKIDPATGRYSLTEHIAAFAGFAPLNEPALSSDLASVYWIDEVKPLRSRRRNCT